MIKKDKENKRINRNSDLFKANKQSPTRSNQWI